MQGYGGGSKGTRKQSITPHSALSQGPLYWVSSNLVRSISQDTVFPQAEDLLTRWADGSPHARAIAPYEDVFTGYAIARAAAMNSSVVHIGERLYGEGLYSTWSGVRRSTLIWHAKTKHAEESQ